MNRLTFGLPMVALVVFTTASTAAQAATEPASCTTQGTLDKHRLLRRLSLDLRNRLPSLEEYEALANEGTVPDATVAAWVKTDDYRLAMRRLHMDLLWVNPEGQALTDVQFRIASDKKSGGGTGIYSIFGSGRRKALRQGTGQETCGDFQQTDFDAKGFPIGKQATGPNGQSYLQDGWVMVSPYWAPQTPIKVCAFDAQAFNTSTGDTACPPGTPGCADCRTSKGAQSPKCGCGPNLSWCYGDIDRELWSDMTEQVLRLVDDVSVGRRPYSELLTTKRAWVNGRLDFWKKHLAHMSNLNKTFNAWAPGDAPTTDAPDYTNATWTEVTRAGPHAGVLTLPGYLLRFQTNRGRANHFRVAFTGQYFVPPATIDTPTAGADGCSDTGDDLTARCTCRHCHQVLEPLAAHFAPFSEAGSALIDDRKLFPVYSPACDPANLKAGKQIPLSCSRFYVTEAGGSHPGTLRPLQFADDDNVIHSQIKANVEVGPVGLVSRIVTTGQFATATVQNVWRRLMARDLILDPSADDHEIALLTTLAAELQAHDQLTTLVTRLVALDQYRRTR